MYKYIIICNTSIIINIFCGFFCIVIIRIKGELSLNVVNILNKCTLNLFLLWVDMHWTCFCQVLCPISYHKCDHRKNWLLRTWNRRVLFRMQHVPTVTKWEFKNVCVTILVQKKWHNRKIQKQNKEITRLHSLQTLFWEILHYLLLLSLRWFCNFHSLNALAWSDTASQQCSANTVGCALRMQNIWNTKYYSFGWCKIVVLAPCYRASVIT